MKLEFNSRFLSIIERNLTSRTASRMVICSSPRERNDGMGLVGRLYFSPAWYGGSSIYGNEVSFNPLFILFSFLSLSLYISLSLFCSLSPSWRFFPSILWLILHFAHGRLHPAAAHERSAVCPPNYAEFITCHRLHSSVCTSLFCTLLLFLLHFTLPPPILNDIQPSPQISLFRNVWACLHWGTQSGE